MWWPHGARLAFTQEDEEAAHEVQKICFVGLLIFVVVAYVSYIVRYSCRLPPGIRFSLLSTLWFSCVLGPLALLSASGPLTSKNAHFSLAFFAVMGSFRLLELGFGTGPPGFDRCAQNFVVYFAWPAEILFDEKGCFRPAKPGLVSDIVLAIAGHMAAGTVMLSIGKATAFVPFLPPDADPARMPWFGLPHTLPAIYLQAVYVYCMLATAMYMHRLPPALFGIDTVNPMRSPLLLSTSVRDFWGRRWNLLIHRLMKRTFFTPLATRSSAAKHVGGLFAFVMSGLFHEYMWLVVNWPDLCGYTPGLPLLFFMSQFVMCAVEAALANTWLGRAAARIPAVLQTMCTTLAILPLGPLFLQGLHAGGMMVQCAEQQQSLMFVRPDDEEVGAGPGGEKWFVAAATALAVGSRWFARLRATCQAKRRPVFSADSVVALHDGKAGA